MPQKLAPLETTFVSNPIHIQPPPGCISSSCNNIIVMKCLTRNKIQKYTLAYCVLTFRSIHCASITCIYEAIRDVKGPASKIMIKFRLRFVIHMAYAVPTFVLKEGGSREGEDCCCCDNGSTLPNPNFPARGLNIIFQHPVNCNT